MTTYVLGGGCFWCIDAVFRRLTGVRSSVCGYAGGQIKDPTYYAVSSESTGHAEVVQVMFDDNVLPTARLLDIFFTIHNPTTLNRQGADVGTQYRSIMLYAGSGQQQEFEDAAARAQKLWDKPIVTEITSLEAFYIAEDEHQDYFNKHPEAGYCSIVIEPKITKARHAYTKWFKEEA